MKKIVLIVALGVLSGCSSIVDGSSQDITITTDPPEANCALTRHGETLGSVNATPGTIHIKKTKYDLTINCAKDGYEDASILNHSDVDAATFGNILFGGLVGWAIDSCTGADNKYDSPVNLTLTKKTSPAVENNPS